MWTLNNLPRIVTWLQTHIVQPFDCVSNTTVTMIIPGDAIQLVVILAENMFCGRVDGVMPLVTPKRAVKAVFVISAIGFIMVDVSILLRDDDAVTVSTGDTIDARNQLQLDSLAFRNSSVAGETRSNSLHRERFRLLHLMHRRNLTNASRPMSELPRVSPGWNLTEIKAAMLAANRRQRISNLDQYDLVASDSAVVIVVQVHNRTEYLRHLVSSLRKAVDIEQTLLVFSHDFYSDELNDIVASVDFCPVCHAVFCTI